MPTTPTYPGVYIEEIPSGVRTITGVATSITAFVGYTARGPVDKAIRISNFGDYERTFGGLQKDSEISYAVQQFFLNGGRDAYVVRVADSTAVAKITLNYRVPGTTNVSPALIASAANPGTWGNNVRLDVDYDTSNPDSTFNLTVTRYELQNGTLSVAEQEQHRNLSMNSGSGTYAINVVNNASRLIHLDRAAITFNQPGQSRSGKIGPTPTLTASDTTIAGILNGTTPFTLVLASPAPPYADMNQLLSAVTNAINAAPAGLNGKLTATLVNADGSPGSDCLNLASTDITDDASSVQIVAVSANDAAPKLKLGLGNGGREKEGASYFRPLQTGTASGDLTSILGTNVGGAGAAGALDVTVSDNSGVNPPVTLPVNLPQTAVRVFQRSRWSQTEQAQHR